MDESTSIFLLSTKNDGATIYGPDGVKTVGDFDILSLTIPIFENISDSLSTNKLTINISGTETTHILPNGHYDSPADLCTQVTNVTGLTCTFNPLTKHITLSGSTNFIISDGSLLNNIMGFLPGQIDGSSNNYTSRDITDLFPFTHLLIDISSMPRRTLIGDGSKSATFVVGFDVFGFLSRQTIRFTTNDYINGMYDQGGRYGTRFPTRITVSLLTTDGRKVKFPLSENQRITVAFAAT